MDIPTSLEGRILAALRVAGAAGIARTRLINGFVSKTRHSYADVAAVLDVLERAGKVTCERSAPALKSCRGMARHRQVWRAV